MTQLATIPLKYLLTALAFGCVCLSVTSVQSASTDGLAGILSADQIDGEYKGTSQQIGKSDQSCSAGQPVTIEIHEDKFKLAWNDRQVFTAKVSPDGTFSATTGTAPSLAEKHMTVIPTLQGHVGSAGLVADYGTRWCRYRLEASHAPVTEHVSHR